MSIEKPFPLTNKTIPVEVEQVQNLISSDFIVNNVGNEFISSPNQFDIESDNITSELNKFIPEQIKSPEQINNNRINENRISYAALKELFRNKFLRNELYIDQNDKRGYNLVTYNITLFCLPEAICINDRINKIAEKGYHIYKNDAIVLCQTSGTDEFYIESMEFTNSIGARPEKGNVSLPEGINLVIKGPVNNDFIDYIMKAAIIGGWPNHMQMPFFVHVEWKGRDSDTDEPVSQINQQSRCFAVRLVKVGGITFDEGGMTIELNGSSFAGSTYDNISGRLQEDISISGYTVGEILLSMVEEMSKIENQTKDNVVLADEFYIEFLNKDGEKTNLIKDWPMVVGKSKDFSQVANQANPNSKETGTNSTGIVRVSPYNGGQSIGVHNNNSNTITSDKKSRGGELIESTRKVTFHGMRGWNIPECIIKVVSHTVEAQKLISGIEDPQSPNAMIDVKEVDPNDYLRKFIQITSDQQIKGYDPGRRRYAVRHYIKIFQQDAPSYSEKQQNSTEQTKEISTNRINGMVKDNFIRKCYHHMYSGLNTEIKNLEWRFDNALTHANNLYSGLVSSYQQRQNSIQIAKAASGSSSLAFADPALHKRRSNEKLKDSIRARTVNEITSVAEPSSTAASERIQEIQRRDDDAITAIRNDDQINFIQGTGATDIRTTYYDTANLSVEERQNLRSGLPINSIAFIEKENRLKVITYTPAKTSQEVIKSNTPIYVSDINDKKVINSLNEGVMFPVMFANSSIGQIDQIGIRKDYDTGKNIFAEIYQNSQVDMVKIELTIRGDPYWIPKSDQKDNKNISVSPEIRESYIIIIADQANTFDLETGVMILNKRNVLNGVYRILLVKNSFIEGEFVQTLDLVRSTAIDLNTVFGGISSTNESDSPAYVPEINLDNLPRNF